MERTMVSEKELLSFLNKELRNIGQHENFRFDSVTRMNLEDRTGCNWSSATIRPTGGKGNICSTDAERIVIEATARFNVKY